MHSDLENTSSEFPKGLIMKSQFAVLENHVMLDPLWWGSPRVNEIEGKHFMSKHLSRENLVINSSEKATSCVLLLDKSVRPRFIHLIRICVLDSRIIREASGGVKNASFPLCNCDKRQPRVRIWWWLVFTCKIVVGRSRTQAVKMICVWNCSEACFSDPVSGLHVRECDHVMAMLAQCPKYVLQTAILREYAHKRRLGDWSKPRIRQRRSMTACAANTPRRWNAANETKTY